MARFVKRSSCDSEVTNDRDANAACNHDGPGQDSCTCAQGYSGSGTECVDMNSCADSVCFDSVVCHERPAAQDGLDSSSFRCEDCPAVYSGGRAGCADIGDCAETATS